jgi:hypothetical protein
VNNPNVRPSLSWGLYLNYGIGQSGLCLDIVRSHISWGYARLLAAQVLQWETQKALIRMQAYKQRVFQHNLPYVHPDMCTSAV